MRRRALASRAGLLLWALALVLSGLPLARSSGSERPTAAEEALPNADEPPALPDLPVHLLLDDGTREGAFGVAGVVDRQFLWLNQLSRPTGVGAMTLEEIWVLFPPELKLEKGASVQLVVYLDPDGDPGNGAELLASYDEAVQSIDGVKYSVYPLAQPLRIVGVGDVLIGVINRFATGVATPFAISPAAIDTGTSPRRSWIGLWTGDPPSLPQLPPDLSIRRLNLTTPGTFMIRGYGRPLEIQEALEIPVLDLGGLGGFALFLAAAGLWLLGHRAR